MGGIKSFLLKSAGFLLLSVSYLALLTAVMVFLLPGELKNFESITVSALSPIAEKAMEQQQAQIQGGDFFEQAKALCASNPEVLSQVSAPDMPGVPKDICEKINSGEFKSINDVNKYVVSGELKQVTSSAFSQVHSQAQQLQNIGNLLALIFVATFVLSAFIIFLDGFNLAVFAHTFFFYSMVLSLFTVISLGIFLLLSPMIVSAIISNLAAGKEMPQEVSTIITSILPPLVEWLRAYILKPLALFLGISLVSIVVWLSKLGLNKPEVKPKPASK